MSGIKDVHQVFFLRARHRHTRNGGAEPSPNYEPLVESETMSIRETIGVVLFLVVVVGVVLWLTPAI